MKKSIKKSRINRKNDLENLLLEESVISWRILMKAFLGVYQSLEKKLLKEECSIARFQILFYLYFDGPLAASCLAKKLFVTRGNISMFLKRLEKEKLINLKLVQPLSKRTFVNLTTKGRVFFEKIFPPHIKRVKYLMPALGAELLNELENIIENTEKLNSENN